jgi:anti-sigma regulatory factor (Ser/Thr protein kinase)
MFHHEALLYDGPDALLAGTLPFIRDGLERDEPVLVAMGEEKLAALDDALGPSDAVFVDMRALGHNPARIIPAWRDFCSRHDGPVRGIGEPIWAGRSGAELVESQLHEALLNVAFDGTADFKLLCPYDTAALDASVIHEACAGHPHVDAQPSRAYRGPERLLAPFEAPLEPPPAHARVLGFELDTLAEVRRMAEGCVADLEHPRGQDLVLAVAELAANSIRHGGGRGILRVWHDDGAVIAEIRDRGLIADPLAGRREPSFEQLGGRGLWIANAVCDLVQVRSGPQGTAVRLHMKPRTS